MSNNSDNERNGAFSSRSGHGKTSRSKYSVKKISKYTIASMMMVATIGIIAYPLVNGLAPLIGVGFVGAIATMIVISLFYGIVRLFNLNEIVNFVEFGFVVGSFFLGLFVSWEIISRLSGYVNPFGLWASAGLIGAILFFLCHHTISQLRARRLAND